MQSGGKYITAQILSQLNVRVNYFLNYFFETNKRQKGSTNF